MLNFVRNAFRNLMEVLLWVILILFAIIGGIVGKMFGSNYVIFSVILGLICGFLTDINLGGFIATILNIDENIKQLRQKFIGDVTQNRSNSIRGMTLNKDGLELQENEKLKIISSYVLLRKEPNQNSEQLNKLIKDEIVFFKKIGDKLSDNNYWCFVEDKDGSKGWCHSEYFERAIV